MFHISCAVKNTPSVEDSLEIENIYYQKWIAGVQGGGSGIHFHVTLKNSLDQKYQLDQLKFDKFEAKFEQVSDREYIAKIKTFENDLILDENHEKEYGNVQPKNFNLNKNEALLIFFNKENKKYYAKRVENIKEKPMLAYPSMEKPKN